MMKNSPTRVAIDDDRDTLSHQLQSNFRQILEAYSRPGTAVTLAHSNGSAALAYLVNLLDESVRFCDFHQQLELKQKRFLQAQQAAVEHAHFIYLDGKRQPQDDLQPALGSLSEPEFGATLVIEVVAILETSSNCSQLELSGPGIDGMTRITVQGLHPDWLAQRVKWNQHFPMGVEMVLCAGEQMLVLTRTTQVTIIESEAWHT